MTVDVSTANFILSKIIEIRNDEDSYPEQYDVVCAIHDFVYDVAKGNLSVKQKEI